MWYATRMSVLYLTNIYAPVIVQGACLYLISASMYPASEEALKPIPDPNSPDPANPIMWVIINSMHQACATS